MSNLTKRGWVFGSLIALWVAACAEDTGVSDGALSGGAAGTTSRGGTSTVAGASGSGQPGSGGSAASSGGAIIVVPVDAGDPDASTGPCEGLECDKTTCTVGACTQEACTAGVVTTLTGEVREPAGKVPLYNVLVYIPNGEVPAITTGASCDRCDTSVLNPVAAALTDTHGKFVLQDVPVGTNVPLVIQVGKWRRQVTIPSVSACTENALTDLELTRLPRNQAEGNIPLIAISTGGLDSMECLPRRMGIDDAEFSTEAGTGRIHLYSGPDLAMGGGMQWFSTKAFDTTLNAGATFTRSTELWGDTATLQPYDIVILSCEGAVFEDEKPMSAREALYEYASIGGRVFASHWHHIWFSDGPDPIPAIGDWDDRQDPQDPATGTINTSFPKGAALADWLVNVGASTVLGEFEIIEARDNLQAVTSAEATSWITVQNENEDDSQAVEYVSFNTPLGVPEAQKCGRMVYTDLHVSSTGTDVSGDPFPSGCEERDLSAQEKAVMFMLFDLSSCIMDDDEPPIVPVPR